MLFTSYTFVFFFLLVALPLRWLVPPRRVTLALFVVSVVFYVSWSLPYAVLLGAMALGSYGAGKLLARPASADTPGALPTTPQARGGRVVLAASIAALLLVLVYFKYTNFLLAELHSTKRIDVALPLGVSFYVFEMVSYVVDVYRGTPPATSVLEYLTYIAYFPHLVAGPIVRANELMPQLAAPRRFDSALASEGMYVALLGFAKKMVFADNLGVFADIVFKNPSAYTGYTAWLGVLAYSGEIFCDFSGYTDIARGASMMMGIVLPENFQLPYNSTSLTEFWRRWHMTLSRWLRDYVYISLGGSRGGRIATYRNLLLTMLLGGIWHGASWTFLAWGAWHGAFLALHKLFLDTTQKSRVFEWLRKNLFYRAGAWATTALVVVLGWVLFRAPTFASASELFHSMLSWHAHASAQPLPASGTLTVRLLLVLVVAHILGSAKVGLLSHRQMRPAARGLLWAAMISGCYFFGTQSSVFIYFQF